ncbi:MAG TPA: manganese efflux pump MntP family protein [Thermoanaerobaculales bacterium]|nr:manganese efflux pump MntP family protein [Thermoanaerobaculales bacterium]HQL29654.1 manganese efflux pump MntP family protein [Thermoanaerobaculales bacterium]
MSWLVLLGVAIGLAMDALAAAIAVSVSLRSVSRRQVLRLAWHFGLFQAVMPIVGWLAGVSVVAWIASWDHWCAFALLAFVGLRAIRSGARGGEPGASLQDPTRGASLVVLSLATSLDALAAGLSFAALGVRVWVPSLVIGGTAGALTAIGMVFGSRLGRSFGAWAEVAGGVVLIGIGLLIVLEHT